MFWNKKKDNVHQLRAKAIALLANEPVICQREVIESLIAEYFPKHHLHSDPRRGMKENALFIPNKY